MDPKELAKLYAAQMAKEAADRAAEKAADVAATKARESAAADAENALNDVAIPYLKEIKSAMAGNFTFDVQREVTSNRRAAPGLDQIDWGLNSSSHTYRGRNDLPGN
jgi:hypothetical protein